MGIVLLSLATRAGRMVKTPPSDVLPARQLSGPDPYNRSPRTRIALAMARFLRHAALSARSFACMNAFTLSIVDRLGVLPLWRSLTNFGSLSELVPKAVALMPVRDRKASISAISERIVG